MPPRFAPAWTAGVSDCLPMSNRVTVPRAPEMTSWFRVGSREKPVTPSANGTAVATEFAALTRMPFSDVVRAFWSSWKTIECVPGVPKVTPNVFVPASAAVNV